MTTHDTDTDTDTATARAVAVEVREMARLEEIERVSVMRFNAERAGRVDYYGGGRVSD